MSPAREAGRSPRLQLSLRVMLVAVALSAVATLGVFRITPWLERRSAYLMMASDCERTAASHRMAAKRVETQRRALSRKASPTPLEREKLDSLEAEVNLERTRAGQFSTEAREYRWAASHPWNTMDDLWNRRRRPLP